MSIPEQHRVVAHAFVDGAEVQRFALLHLCVGGGKWVDDSDPSWLSNCLYRIKPKKVKKWRWVFREHTGKLDITDIEYEDHEVIFIYQPVQKIDSTMVEV